MKMPDNMMSFAQVRAYYQQLECTNLAAIKVSLPANSVRAQLGIKLAELQRKYPLSYHWTDLDTDQDSDFVRPLDVYIELARKYNYASVSADYSTYTISETETTAVSIEQTGIEQACCINFDECMQHFVFISERRYQIFISCKIQKNEILVIFPDAGLLQISLEGGKGKAGSLLDTLLKNGFIKLVGDLVGDNPAIQVASVSKAVKVKSAYLKKRQHHDFCLTKPRLSTSSTAEWINSQIKTLFMAENIYDPPPVKLIDSATNEKALFKPEKCTNQSLDYLYGTLCCSLCRLRVGYIDAGIVSHKLAQLDMMLSKLLRFTLEGVTSRVYPVWQVDIEPEAGCLSLEPAWQELYKKMERCRQWHSRRSLIIVISTPEDVMYLQIMDYPTVSFVVVFPTQTLFYHDLSTECDTVQTGRPNVQHIPGAAVLSSIWWNIAEYYKEKAGAYSITFYLSDEHQHGYGLPSRTDYPALCKKMDDITQRMGCPCPGVYPSSKVRNRHVVAAEKYGTIFSRLIKEKAEELDQAGAEFHELAGKTFMPYTLLPATTEAKVARLEELKESFCRAAIPDHCLTQLRKIIKELDNLKKGETISEEAANLLTIPADEIHLDDIRQYINKLAQEQLRKAATDI